MSSLGILLSAAMAFAAPEDDLQPSNDPVDIDAGDAFANEATEKHAATNIGGGGQGDNTCDCGTVGRAGSSSAAFVAAALGVVVLFARRRRID